MSYPAANGDIYGIPAGTQIVRQAVSTSGKQIVIKTAPCGVGAARSCTQLFKASVSLAEGEINEIDRNCT